MNQSVTVNGNPVSCAPSLGNGSGNIQNVALLQNKTSVAWQARDPFTALDAYLVMTDVAGPSKLDSFNNSSLDIRVFTSAPQATISGHVLLWDEAGAFIRSIAFTVVTNGVKVSSSPDVYETASQAGDIDLSQVWVGSAAKHHVAIERCTAAGATIYVSTRPYR